MKEYEFEVEFLNGQTHIFKIKAMIELEAYITLLIRLNAHNVKEMALCHISSISMVR